MRQPPLNKRHTKTAVPQNFAIWLVLWLILTLILASLPHLAALAKWDGEPGENSAWYESLYNPVLGISCCGVGDSVPVDDSDWRFSADGTGYEVYFKGNWVRIPDEAVLHRVPNPTGHAVLFVLTGDRIVCFVRPTDT